MHIFLKARIEKSGADFQYFDYDETLDEIIVATEISGITYFYFYPIADLKTNQSV